MAAITGHEGDVTFAAGHTTDVHAWRVNNFGDLPIVTPFAPAGDAEVRVAGIGDWDGEYRCWQPSTVSTDLTMAGGFYTTNAYSYTIELVCKDLLTTPFGVDYNTRIGGLVSASGSYDCYLDDTTPLPTRGSSDTITLTVDAGETYEIPIYVGTVEDRVAASGDDRHVVVNWESRGEITATTVPVIGVTGAAEFVAEGARKLTGNILITRIGISLTYAREAAEWTLGFMGNGDLTAA